MPLVIGRFLRGVDYSLILGNFLATTFGSVLYLPPMLKWLAGAEVEMDAGRLFGRAAALILLPYVLSLAVNRGLGAPWRRIMDRFSPPAVLVLMFAIVALVISKARNSLVWNADLAVVSAMVVGIYAFQGLSAWLAGTALGFRRTRATMAVLGSSRNNQVSLGIAMLQFPPAAAIPCVIGFIVHHLASAMWLWLLKKDE
jgi:predicted Na+-dependent transporter